MRLAEDQSGEQDRPLRRVIEGFRARVRTRSSASGASASRRPAAARRDSRADSREPARPDPTSDVEPDSERSAIQMVESLRQGRTTFVIAPGCDDSRADQISYWTGRNRRARHPRQSVAHGSATAAVRQAVPSRGSLHQPRRRLTPEPEKSPARGSAPRCNGYRRGLRIHDLLPNRGAPSPLAPMSVARTS